MRRRKAGLFYWPDVNDVSFILESDVELVWTPEKVAGEHLSLKILITQINDCIPQKTT